jgi:SAM-dependent methyltransferase
MTDIQLLIDLHKDWERQGPGSPEVTRKALELLGIRKEDPLKIADIGCGSGGQTITLAQHTSGPIKAVDLFPEFLEELGKKAEELGLKDRISTSIQSMQELDFEEEELDLIWSEGAIYIMGFEEGVRNWRRFLKPGGFLAVSEVSWLTHSRPAEIEEYWGEQYPEIDTISNKIRLLEENGFSPLAHFVLPSHCWLDNYYRPLEQRFDAFLERHQNTTAARRIVEDEKREIQVYEKFKDYYSYGFYLAQKHTW